MSTNEQSSDREWAGKGGAETSFPDPDSVPVQDENVVARQISGETILVPIKTSPGDLDSIFTLNEVASKTWELIDGNRTIAEISEAISDEFDVRTDIALADTCELVGNFRDAKVASINN